MKRKLVLIIVFIILLSTACTAYPTRARNEVGDLFDQLAETEEQAKQRIYDAVKDGVLSADERKLLNDGERGEYELLGAAVRSAFVDGSREELEQRIAEWSDFADTFKSILSSYRSIDQTPFSQAELSMLSANVREEYYSYQERIDEAFEARNSKDLDLLKKQWESFRSSAKKDIDAAKEKMLQDWVADADLGSAITGILTLGTVKTTTSISGHKITVSVQYLTNFGASDEQIKSAMDSYLSWMSSSYQSSVNALGFYVRDVCIRVEYRNADGALVSSKEFSVTKATQPPASSLPPLKREENP